MLNSETINKIAAGEVIIRPVSVVKELVENAIDAGADQITVIVEAGGKNRITVRDNGCGIAYNEIPLAFKRHATSKLSTIGDLESIESLGFRGEALSSVSAVAKVQITTRFANEEVGSLTLFEGGKLINQRVCAYNCGTEITVRDLFYNTPARRKHMEKDKKEETIVRDLLEKIAISHPGIRFQLSSNGRIVLDTPGTGKVMDVVKGLYGVDTADSLIALSYENKPMKLEGFVGNLKTMRNHREDQVFFINGRYIKNNRLAQALDDAYEGYSMKHQHPLGIIFIELPGRMLDVNIHPAKTEIKILNESLICLLFKQGIRETLRNTNLIVELGTADNDYLENNEKKTRFNNKIADNSDLKNHELNNQNSETEPNVSSTQITRTESQTTIETMLQKTPTTSSGDDPNLVKPITEISKDKQRAPAAKGEALLAPDLNNRVAEAPRIFELDQAKPEKSIPGSEPLPVLKTDVKDLAKMKIVGQLFNVYILLEGEKEIYLLDQHAAHEAFITQELMEIFDRKESIPSQGLMTPIPIKIRPKDLAGIENALAEYKRFGYDCDVFGEDTLLVRSVPVLLGEPQSLDLLKSMIEENLFDSDENTNTNMVFSEKAKNKIITMACKAAIKGGQSLTQAEIRKLLENLMKLSNPYTCPHGRPIIMRLKEYELMKLFKRVI
ncbi:DNA mismatch repair endonuclease MutL [Acetobacterium sp.]|uniref:DNA mismatch repair endonuclease MutL n=1 Tax=Acetobacterium sp. TaxID=1872094 RepID=UPI00271E722B|nr:DNA mismatch repair endonuclease MutL [Acetobacterium sp.]MDO9492020.1 DNA mismatch repair endonuclease MutL [Acetobacterium sp.]